MRAVGGRGGRGHRSLAYPFTKTQRYDLVLIFVATLILDRAIQTVALVAFSAVYEDLVTNVVFFS